MSASAVDLIRRRCWLHEAHPDSRECGTSTYAPHGCLTECRACGVVLGGSAVHPETHDAHAVVCHARVEPRP